MKRKILLRLWNPFSNSYLYDVENVYQCLAQQNIFDGIQKSRFEQTLPFDHAKDGFVWEQFTGLPDKNGVKIFEGDIIKWIDSEYEYRVVFEHGAFYCYHLKIQNWDASQLRWGLLYRFFELAMDIEVIGNIHENHELLKQESNG